ncbi:MAG: DUF2267 domain-containing protein [Sphingomonadales bacterium]
MTQPAEVEYASQQFQDWLTALKTKAMLQTHNQSQAIMRGVLMELRRHMTTGQVLDFADALPPLPRGIFLERWRPGEAAPLDSAGAFMAAVTDRLSPHTIPPESAAADVFAVIAAHVGAHNAAIMRAALPDALRPLWPDHPDKAGEPGYLRRPADGR